MSSFANICASVDSEFEKILIFQNFNFLAGLKILDTHRTNENKYSSIFHIAPIHQNVSNCKLFLIESKWSLHVIIVSLVNSSHILSFVVINFEYMTDAYRLCAYLWHISREFAIKISLSIYSLYMQIILMNSKISKSFNWFRSTNSCHC